MSTPTVSQLAEQLGAFAVAERLQLPPAPAPKPAPAAAKPVAAPAGSTGAATPGVAPAKQGADGSASPASGPATPAKPSAASPAAAAPKPAAPAAAAAAPAPAPLKPVELFDFSVRGVHLDVCIKPESVVDAARVMDAAGYAIDAVSGQDWLAQGLMEVIYDFLHFQTNERVAIRTRIPRATPSIATISKVFPGANWHERETHDMFGIVFEGHPNLAPFLLPDDADFHPLRKDYNP